ncbi:hypothetical protein NLG97_g2461 [Lecanicillium saksenae]|uniref:Uncharacterized protein n=1 Tax=Lecanicillium saksenae TaxID=468837 RepID=A0ACC1R125_9HYPO|nr:hypothetical protein NLG97_g2461 [Lecanicillium saksenae]
MNLSKALRSGSSLSDFWRIEGFSADFYNAFYVTPLAGRRGAQLPPYHLLCILENDEEDRAALIAAAFPSASEKVPARAAIEKLAEDVAARLQDWVGDQDVLSLLDSLTIGSRFHLESKRVLNGPGVWLCPNLELEQRYLTLPRLQQLWSGLSFDFPPTLRFEDLRAVSRLHDSVSTVLLPDGKQAIFKGPVRIIARMYHELRELLRLPSHPNIVSRPRYIVTRKARNKSENVVCGFILPYYSGGSLLDRLKYSQKVGLTGPNLRTKMKWIFQLTSALRHIHCSENGFYSDLRLDNIVLTEQDDIVLIDWEQCGSARRWLHPAAWPERGTSGSETNWATSPINPIHMPGGIFYSSPPLGYFKRFAGATDLERQMMENYSLAKVMWCIFEEQVNEQTISDLVGESGAATPVSLWKGGSIFPHFQKTPRRMRYWIWLCTRTSLEWGEASCRCSGEESHLCGMTGARSQQAQQAGPTLEETWMYLESTFDKRTCTRWS